MWNKSRIAELNTALTMVYTLGKINQMPDFMGNAEKCAQAAEKLTTADLDSGDESFISFVQQELKINRDNPHQQAFAKLRLIFEKMSCINNGSGFFRNMNTVIDNANAVLDSGLVQALRDKSVQATAEKLPQGQPVTLADLTPNTLWRVPENKKIDSPEIAFLAIGPNDDHEIAEGQGVRIVSFSRDCNEQRENWQDHAVEEVILQTIPGIVRVNDLPVNLQTPILLRALESARAQALQNTTQRADADPTDAIEGVERPRAG